MKTPQLSYPQLSEALGTTAEVFLKREDLHNYGSHKGRSIPLMIKKYFDIGQRNFVISSSGNAALAALLYTENHNKNNSGDPIKLQIFVGKKIDQGKLSNLSPQGGSALGGNLNSFVNIDQVDNPKQQAFKLDKNGTHKLLRQSTDDSALEGYTELAEELNHIDNLSAIFIPTSSGTTAQALGKAFEKLKNKPQIHIVQTDFCHPIVESISVIPAKAGIQSSIIKVDRSIAGAIVDKIAHRKNQVVETIKQSNGSGWIVSDEEIKQAMNLVKKTCSIDISPNSSLSVAGLKKAINNEWKWNGPVVCLITGQ
jgi:threonine synthase